MITQFKLFEFDVDKQYFFKFQEIEDYFNGSVVDIENFFVHLQGSAIVITHVGNDLKKAKEIYDQK